MKEMMYKSDHYANHTKSLHPPRRITLVIPFRDREEHLARFRSHFANFILHDALPGSIEKLNVIVVEQLDPRLFKRGWLFNVGFTLATQKEYGYYPEKIQSECIGVQDIDELPVKNVDMGDCDTPLQWAAELERFDSRVPYLTFAGGNVLMTEKHWKEINGFNNLYQGWGAEDDELFLRLQQKKLLLGNC